MSEVFFDETEGVPAVADTTGQSSYPLIDALLLRGHEFSFTQAMRIARRLFGPDGPEEVPGVPWQERVSIRPELSLAFPAADLARVERSGNDPAELLIATTFLGLYGVSSPLPTHYTEELLDEAADGSTAGRDFLDILNRRLYHLLFEAWSKYQLFIRVAEEKNHRDLERLFCLIGPGEKELRDSVPDAWSLLRYLGLFNQVPRTAAGLQTLLRDALGFGTLQVEQCVQRLVPVPEDQRMRLGVANVCLGVNAVLGNEIADRMGKCRIHIGPLSREQFDSLLPGAPLHDKLARLTRLYVADALEFDLKITMAAGEARPILLGNPDGPRLGLNSWCFFAETPGEVSAIFPIAHAAEPAPSPAADDFGSAPDGMVPSTLLDYYQQELARLRDLATVYAKAHPASGAMVAGHPADPSVERLFEGAALMHADLQMKIDDDIPEFIHEIINVVQPGCLRPAPAATIVVFSPKSNCTGPQSIPAGSELNSVPVDGTACRFTTCHPVEIHPLTLTDASFAQPPGSPATITLSLKLTGLALSEWKLNNLRLFLAGEYQHASDLHLVLVRHLKRIVIAPIHGGLPVALAGAHLKAASFEDSEARFPSTGSEAGHQVVREYFIQPERLLFLDLQGWENWCERGNGSEFEIRFELNELPFSLHRVSNADFVLFAVPAVNLFKHRAEPITLDGSGTPCRIRPSGNESGHFLVHSIEKIYSHLRFSTETKLYSEAAASGHISVSEPKCRVICRASALHPSLEFFVSVLDHPESGSPTEETLRIDLLCTNGSLPRNLQRDDICVPTGNSPGFAAFKNCTPVTGGSSPVISNNRLWRAYSREHIQFALLTKENLISILQEITLAGGPNQNAIPTTLKRLEGLLDFQVEAVDGITGPVPRRGWEVRLTLRQSDFAGPGDMFLFCSMLESFLGSHLSQDCFICLKAREITRGYTHEWPKRMGKRPLI